MNPILKLLITPLVLLIIWLAFIFVTVIKTFYLIFILPFFLISAVFNEAKGLDLEKLIKEIF